MKTNLYPFAASLLLCATASAQIVIGVGDMPSAGDTVRYWNAVTAQDPAPAGPGFLWDFSGLVPGAEGADTMVSVGSTPLAYQFFFNNALLYPAHKANYAMRGTAIGFQGFSLSDLFDYYKNNDEGFRNVGFGANVNGLPASVQRNPVDWIYRFPLEYGDVDSSFSHFQVAVPTLGFFGQDQWRRNEVDGWGTLILPADTFEVLRVRSRINRTDTVHIDQFNIGFSLPEPETVEYKWIAAGMDEPVLQVTTTGGVNTVVRFWYSPDSITTGVAGPTPGPSAQVWPNPAAATVQVGGMGAGPLQLIGADGRVVRRFPASHQPVRTLEVIGLAPGTYLLKAPDTGAVRRVVIGR